MISSSTELVKLLKTFLQRAVGTRRTVLETLQSPIELRAHVGIGAARQFHPKLPLQILVELAVDGADPHSAGVARGSAAPNFLRRLADIARRLRVRDIGGDKLQSGLRRPQTGQPTC